MFVQKLEVTVIRNAEGKYFATHNDGHAQITEWVTELFQASKHSTDLKDPASVVWSGDTRTVEELRGCEIVPMTLLFCVPDRP